ncbi:methyl-accepting chemotaxis protein [Citreimonas salinaria]|uniref:Methyl-accepting chemotaxis protein n=1 Tax=Citreimonas salinaria TaxID=321339 RepID=A0A1H3IMV4_9RHOB|nr:methyl-accepting chemotaxis protein [Citreimonas salinaria]SDY28619.1 methyl-accepting chemotaxis protein [Citreimonas salinaria]
MMPSTKDAMFNVRSVFVKCAALMALTTIVVAGGMAWVAFSTVQNRAHAAIVKQADQLVPPYTNALVTPMRFGVEEKIVQTVQEALDAAHESGLAALAIGADGVVIGMAGDETAHAELTTLARQSLSERGPARGDNGLLLAVPIRPDAGAEPMGVLAMAMRADVAQPMIRRDKALIAAVAAGLFVVMMALTLWALRRVLGKPLTELRGAVARIGAGDYNTEMPLTGHADELGAMARDLEGMIAMLRKGRAADEIRRREAEAQVKVVASLGDGLDALAHGILTKRLSDAFPQEYEALRQNFNRAIDSLHDVIAAVTGNTQSISRNAEEIAEAADELSGRTETQAATLEQSAAALDQLLASVRSAASNATEADRAVGFAREKAARNDEIMRAAMSAMGAIEKSSDKIADIITVIDDIAFQTNLLALNAGVEAARAGESGKGFAVVASEVRTLAQRSSEAAHQIKDLILGSSVQVKKGAQLVEEAGTALGAVVEQIGEISNLMSGIAAGAAEQSQGLNEINTGVGDLDKVTQQNAAMVQSSATTAHRLRSEAGTMTQLVSRFQIDRSRIRSAEEGTWQAEAAASAPPSVSQRRQAG